MIENKRQWSPPQIILTALITMVVWSAIGFSWFGYGFNWETQTSAARASNTALIENLALICESQARQSVGAEKALTELKTLQLWKRHGFVEAAGWATMPGADAAQSGVAARCGEILVKV